MLFSLYLFQTTPTFTPERPTETSKKPKRMYWNQIKNGLDPMRVWAGRREKRKQKQF